MSIERENRTPAKTITESEAAAQMHELAKSSHDGNGSTAGGATTGNDIYIITPLNGYTLMIAK